jgi:hypothetical protein
MATFNRDVSLTYTLEDFVKMQVSDQLTFRNFSTVSVVNGVELTDKNLIEDFLPELMKNCIDVTLDRDEYVKYKYAPDLLAFDVYGSVQLDFIILYMNGIIDPKDFDFKTLKLVRSSILKDFLNHVFGSQRYILENNKYENGVPNNVN